MSHEDEDFVAEGEEDDDELPAFDPSSKKKKKKQVVEEDVDEDEEDLPAFDPSSKKKKKKANVEDDEDDDMPLDFGKKKKKKRGPAPTSASSAPVEALPSTDEEYGYEFLLSRVFALLQENNPDLSARQEDYRIKIPPPNVGKEGTRKTVWTNFADICDKMGRKYDHVMQYALTEMGTTGSLDAEKHFIIRGRFQPKQIQAVLRHYVKDYVICRTCKSPDTTMKKENRMHFLECRACGSTRSVAPIKAGYQAIVGKRRFQKTP